MLRKLNNFLNCMIGAFIGSFIGKVIFEYLEYKKYGAMYKIQSAPWYVGIIIPGIVTVVILVVIVIIKRMIRKKLKEEKNCKIR